ncbi:MAG: Gfo/Idh/MocA family oxidoreductase [Lachnospiraceae bacterium]|nr:Gfo/Idh/MocA family oxidoreductase [Lachnospiraceae bacterium]
MNIVVIGLGSMGKRRIRLIKELFPEYTIIGIDAREDRRTESEALFSISCFSSLDSLDIQVDCAFVCTSPLSHSALIKDCLSRGWHVFTELNLVYDGYDENILLAKEKEVTLFLSSTFLYREEIQYIGSRISSKKRWNYIYHIGQYLPDWHPWETYKDFFIGDKRTNGCREILAIELPWLNDSFGEITSAHAASDKMTDLDIDFHDNFLIKIDHKNGNKGILVVDVVSPVAVRKLEAYAENAYISWDGTPDHIHEYDPVTKELVNVTLKEAAEHKDGYRAFIVENAYKNEIRQFFDIVLNHVPARYTFEQDKKILEIIDSLGA